MANNNKNNESNELLNRICSGGSITPQDLGTPTSNTQPTNYLTEGTRAVHFELNTKNKRKN